MALLSQCNHSIITFGSFGFWTGYLSDGITIYPDATTTVPYTFSRKLYEAADITNFVPLPIKMEEDELYSNSAGVCEEQLWMLNIVVLYIMLFKA